MYRKVVCKDICNICKKEINMDKNIIINMKTNEMIPHHSNGLNCTYILVK